MLVGEGSASPTCPCYDILLISLSEVLDVKNLCTVLVSPRQRAHKTFHLLFEHVTPPPHMVTETVREWDYGKPFHIPFPSLLTPAPQATTKASSPPRSSSANPTSTSGPTAAPAARASSRCARASTT